MPLNPRRALGPVLLTAPVALFACAVPAAEDAGATDGPLFEPVEVGRVATDAGASRGVAWGDFDDDGDPDLYVVNTGGQWNAFYRNTVLGARTDGRSEGDSGSAGARRGAARTGPSTEAGAAPFLKMTDPDLSPFARAASDGGSSEGVSWVDHDGDGDLDLFVANRGGEPDFLYRNDGAEGLTRVLDSGLTDRAAGSSMACWADVDGDGWLDVFLTGYGGASNMLYRNGGEGRFDALADSPLSTGGGEARACGWADADGNGFPDLYVANNTALPNRYFLNDGEWRFREVTAGHAVEHEGYSYGVSWADYDADGDLDLFLANFDRPNVMYRNDGTGLLEPDTASLLSRDEGGASKGHTWGDYDLDGDLDLFVANGTYGPDMRNFLYLNEGNGTFVRDMRGRVAEHADTSAGAAWADYDLDGDLDLFVASWGSADQRNRLYRNTSETTRRGWIGFRLRDDGPNTHAVGARVTVVARGHDGHVRRMDRWNWPVTGYGSQNDMLLHFGLSDARGVDSVLVTWPDGGIERHEALEGRRVWRVRRGATPEVVGGGALRSP